ncbi:MAG: hypothetical protein RJA70_3122 [Pseudomonadota bacterium]
MSSKQTFPSDIAFTDTVKALQLRNGSRRSYARMEAGGGWRTELTDDIAAFIHEQTSVFLATVNADGQPYVQHRGGPKGFLKVLDEHTLGLADFRGNKQYISVGNLSENKKAHLFLIDYEHQRRVKIWGEAEAIENDPALLSSLMPADYEATPERAIVFHVKTWDANCPQHIPQRFEAADVKAALEKRDARIVALEAEVASLRLRSS